MPSRPAAARPRPEDLLTVLERRADEGSAPFLHIDGDGEAAASSRTLAALWEAARRRAGALRGLGVRAGDRVALVLDTCPEFLEVFYAAHMLRAAPVPVAPPFAFASLGRYPERLAAIAHVSAPRVIVVDARLRRLVAGMLPGGAAIGVVAPGDLDGPPCAPEAVRPDDLALVQYTSGSTSRPRGVALTHANLVANTRDIVRALELGPDDRKVSWLPLFHDMGLIGGVLSPLEAGAPIRLLPPAAFVRRPVRWLRAVSEFRATLSTAPNFGYQLCVDRISEGELEGLDLRCWRRALNGAEPVRPETLAAFERRFASVGFRPSAFLPVYGLAEATLAAAFTPLDRGARIDEVDAAALTATGRAEPVRPGRPARRVVSCGRPLPGSEVRIVDPADGLPLPERREGEITLRGLGVMRGYLEDPGSTAEALRDGWLRTGDLGYLADGELHVTGRRKSVLIRAGRKYHAADLEAAAERVPGVRRGCSAAFSVDGAAREELVLVVEHARGAAGDADLARRVGAAVAEREGVVLDRVHVAPPRSVPKTSSGKVQRGACRELLLAGALGRRGLGDRLAALVATIRGLWRGAAASRRPSPGT